MKKSTACSLVALTGAAPLAAAHAQFFQSHPLADYGQQEQAINAASGCAQKAIEPYLAGAALLTAAVAAFAKVRRRRRPHDNVRLAAQRTFEGPLIFPQKSGRLIRRL